MNKMFTGLGRGMFVLVMVAALCAPRVSDASCSTIRAVSMRVLQEELRACQGAGECAEELQKLAYLSRILGYLVDRATGDVIILGQVDPNLPSLYVEDFVVALRSTWGKYRSSPAPICSIDPDPNVVRRLERIGRNILSSRTPEQAEGHISDWHRTCRSPQTVRVLGVPFHTRFAHVMVEADYAMKSIVDGTDSLAVEGLSSLVDMTLDQARRDLERGGPVSVSLSMNRFWFYAGENQYDEAEDIFLISKSPVELSTRETNISNSRIIDTGRVNPLARDFAEAFTSHYQEAAVQRPFFAELENLYRFVALTKIMQYKKVQIESGL